MEIGRDGKVVKPITTTVGPIAARLPDGSTKQLARGFFSFTADAFDASADVSVVFVGKSGGETACLVDRARLQALR